MIDLGFGISDCGFKRRGARHKTRMIDFGIYIWCLASSQDYTIYIIYAKHKILKTKHLMNLPLKNSSIPIPR
jgi:hypothetical protein